MGFASAFVSIICSDLFGLYKLIYHIINTRYNNRARGCPVGPGMTGGEKENGCGGYW